MFLRKRVAADSRRPAADDFEAASGMPLSHRIRSIAVGSQAIGALAIGALAFGAVAIGALAVGRLAIGRARVRRLEIDELVVRRLRVTDALQAPAGSRAEG